MMDPFDSVTSSFALTDGQERFRNRWNIGLANQLMHKYPNADYADPGTNTPSSVTSSNLAGKQNRQRERPP
jgi:hypothetical protein